MIYRVIILYTDPKFKGQSGGNAFLRATSKEEAKTQFTTYFKNQLIDNGFKDIEFKLDVFESSDSEVEQYKKGMHNHSQMMN